MSDEQIGDVGEILPVRIRESGDVDNETVNLRRPEGDQVVWRSLAGAFTIHFPRSPFQDNDFQVPAGGIKGSGPLRDSASGRYDYEIRGLTLAKSADPTLIVKP